MAFADEIERNFSGSVQLDYLAVATEDVGRTQGLDGATVELSLKLAIDFDDEVSSNIKICVACHGIELGMAFFDIRKSDLLNFRVGRFTPRFGNFPLRHDPANHRTSDKPLPYDMGRMLRTTEWNMSVLPAPWVDNGIEISGTKFIGDTSRVDYAVYAIGGAKGNDDAFDLDYVQSRSRNRYYVDNNSRPSVGARLAGSFGLTDNLTISLGASGMGGHYDPSNNLSYLVGGADFVLQYKRIFWRSEYLVRRTEVFLGDDPASRFKYGPGADGEFDNFFIKDGFYSELEYPVSSKVDLIGRWDGMRRIGNVAANSRLRSESAILRYTAALAYKMKVGLRIKSSIEFYDFSDFEDEVAMHIALAGPF
ncbi:MAG: hypothetical protein JKY56_11235 [Kofleriaceae bacterium]|nr:hypothetical protein [Kofleriaceae bacterium]